MSHSSLKKLVAAVSCIAACGLLLAAVPNPACAQAPEGVSRTFLVKVPLSSTTPDFTSADSLGLVVAPPNTQTTSSSLVFSDWSSEFAGTECEILPATHLTVGGAEVPGTVAWLLPDESDETPPPPPTGAFAFTGPNSAVVQSLPRKVRLCEGVGTGCSASGTYTIDEDYGTEQIIVVTAVFSR